MKVGCHVSIAGGVVNAPERAHNLGCEVMQIFSRSPRGGPVPLITDEVAMVFIDNCNKYNIKNVYIHTPYFINLASINGRIRRGSVAVIREELERASLIGAKYVMTHLGSAKDTTMKRAIAETIHMLGETLAGYTGISKLLLENSAGSGDIIGSSLSDLAHIIKKVDSRNIGGICLDTQHSFASGYDWRDFDKTIKKMQREVGVKNIRLIHANDSMTDMGSRVDRHEHIGVGKIGEIAFKKIVAWAEEKNIDMICETKDPRVVDDIKLIKKMRK